MQHWFSLLRQIFHSPHVSLHEEYSIILESIPTSDQSRCISRGNPTRIMVWKMERSFITKRQRGAHAARSGAEESRQRGESLCMAKLTFTKRYLSHQLPRAINTSRAAALCWFQVVGQNSVAQLQRWNTRTAWEDDWDRNSRVRTFF